MSINSEPQAIGKDSGKVESTANVDGVDVHYIQAGKGPDLVMVSGLMSTTRSFDFILNNIAKDFHATGIDLPGFGKSGRYPKERRYSPVEHAKTVVALMDKLGIEKSGFVGDSYGCAVAMVAAVEYPERFSYLVLQGPPKFDFLGKVARLHEYAARSMAKDVQKLKPLSYWWRRINPEFRHMSDEQLRAADEALFAASAKAGIEAGFDMVNFDTKEYASKLGIPTLVVEGDNPLMQLASAGTIIKNSAPEGLVKIKRLKGSHTLLQQKPQEFIEEVQKFSEVTQ